MCRSSGQNDYGTRTPVVKEGRAHHERNADISPINRGAREAAAREIGAPRTHCQGAREPMNMFHVFGAKNMFLVFEHVLGIQKYKNTQTYKNFKNTKIQKKT